MPEPVLQLAVVGLARHDRLIGFRYASPVLGMDQVENGGYVRA